MRARAGHRRYADPPRAAARGEWKTSLVFWGAGADSAGWLVRCLDEFGRRAINLTKIESRPKRERMGSYMFFVDLQGQVDEPAVAEALNGLEKICEQVRVLGSYRGARGPAEIRPGASNGRERRIDRPPRLLGAIATLRRCRWIAPFHR